jgi:hypothetical protein
MPKGQGKIKRNTAKAAIKESYMAKGQYDEENYNRIPEGLKKDTTTGISKMKTGGICKGGGAAIKGTDFKGVF